ncbi:hypothetical protein [Shewanella sp. YIC-542]|uniref:hypothetical protein n=1 Tax=Shewanella mytili TaxID=3377111 RepID=UPI00398E4620
MDKIPAKPPALYMVCASDKQINTVKHSHDAKAKPASASTTILLLSNVFMLQPGNLTAAPSPTLDQQSVQLFANLF